MMRTRNRIGAALSVALAAAVVGMPTACAQPSSFPDLSKFTEIAADNPVLTTNRMGGHDAVFATPDGLMCSASSGSQSCESDKLGVIPGFPSNARHTGATTSCPASENVASDDTGSEFAYSQNCEGTTGLPVLQPGQKVTVGEAVCVVGDNRLTACKNGTHGFVIQQSGSWTF